MNVKRNRWALVVLLGPAVLLYLLIYLYPTVRTTIMSFYSPETITSRMADWEFVGFGNFVKLSESTIFIQSMINIGKIWLFGGFLVLLLALVFAIILTSGVRFKAFFKSVIYLPNVISAVALGTMWLQYVYSPKYGLFKNIFSFLGLESLANFQWTDPNNQFWAMLIAYNFGMVGYFMITYMAGIERIPTDYYEAATLEGANIVQQFFHITLPLLKGVVKTTVVLWSVRAVGFFVWSQIFSPLVPDTSTITPMVYMYQAVFGTELTASSDPGAGAAVGVLMTVIVVILFFLSNALIREEDVDF